MDNDLCVNNGMFLMIFILTDSDVLCMLHRNPIYHSLVSIRKSIAIKERILENLPQG